MLTCTDCEENFNSKDTLKRHKYERHCKKCTITVTVEGTFNLDSNLQLLTLGFQEFAKRL
ncbi:hypothetical protein BCV72DRAFT_235968 [Rhizopus microsporus var. microsporus]|uniref:C2H2-type domain-containing protein n=2 Tax=Rhizopus microsporus TaxID=58291 RepID=A0A2G4SSL6_RHIZD|nr:uncharacterized protein RHIMIDRAFT_256195 [Rhizopus microsporus ATCC 52813]ORE01638.1 hypothetical protein BCV72DRAFT_235965 [Rhizopus microsporus var. microsporus]ORE01641.1 hypothetical protein BCV72DRAFT_235968 [Rhizopus microsporus var. microsporus]PHZ11777.1 hypothetical protein RHIMIDRAFT_256195 [Rhizopus microsporus ATCC 52813]